MSLSISPNSSARFHFIHQGHTDDSPLQQLHIPLSTEKGYDADPTVAIASITKFQVIFDDSRKGFNLELNRKQNPFAAAETSLPTPADSTSSVNQTANRFPAGDRPILYHSAGMWIKSKKYWCSKVDMRYLYYQHFLNIQKVSRYQLGVITSMLNTAKRQSRIEDSITLSLFLHESSGLRIALDADVEMFRKWHDGEYKGTLRRKFSSERMLFKGYVDELNDHWKPLTSEELFNLPIIRMLSRTPSDILSNPLHKEIKDINQRTYFNTLVHHVGKDRGHTYR